MTETTWSASFAADRLPTFKAIIEKANRRLRKAGAPEFAPEISEPEFRTITLPGGTEILVPYVNVSLESYRLSLGDFTFVASLVPEEAGITVHTAPGESLDGFRPEDFRCDHCKVDRYRTRNYIVRDNRDGSLVQLGHNCIELYTGLKPKGLWVLDFSEDQLAEFREDEGGWGGGGGSRDYSVAIDTVLATAWAITNGGRNYTSVKAAEAYYEASGGEGHKDSTSSLVRGHLAGRPKPYRGDDSAGRDWDAIQAKVQVNLADTDLLDAIKASAETLRAGTDYADNMAVILAAPSGAVSLRNIGVLASLVAVYARQVQILAERKAEAEKPVVQGFVAPVKDAKGKATRLKGLEITVTRLREFDSDYGTRTLLVGLTADGHAVEWWASGTLSVLANGWRGLEEGDVITLDASVKGHREAGADKFTKQDTTVLTRGTNLVLAMATAC